MAEPNVTPNFTTLTVTDPERRLLERLIVMAAPGLAVGEQRAAMALWERVSADTVAP